MKRILIALAAVVCLSACHKTSQENLADYTVIIYGMAGGQMDCFMETIWKETKALLPEDGKVRVLAVNKYGKDGDHYSGRYGKPGELAVFELTPDTELESIHREGADDHLYQLYNPENLGAVLRKARTELPAREYILALYGHGGGFRPETDHPTRGVLSDEWLDRKAMDMYQLTSAIQLSGIPQFKAILFHNCFMGGMENLTQVSSLADYFIATPFMLTSEENPLIPMLVKNIQQQKDFETAARQTLVDSEDRLYEGLVKERVMYNGNIELIKSSELAGVCSVTEELATRLCELYPTQREAIDRATCGVYQFCKGYSFFDLQNYAAKLAEETGDAKLNAIHGKLADAFGRAILLQHSFDLGALPLLPVFSLSVVLTDRSCGDAYLESYKLSAFHQLTGWGDWLSTNPCTPAGNPAGQGE